MAAVNYHVKTNGDGWQTVYYKGNRKRLSDTLQHHQNIPIEILSCLPVKSLLRFRCISKAWRSLISNPKFTLDYNSSQKHHKVAIRYAPGFYSNEIRSIVYSVDCDNPEAYVVSPMVNECDVEWFQILGSCNGLFLASHYMDLFLWNPSTRQCTKMLSVASEYSFWPRDYYASYGLCYDSSSDDYKVVIAYRGKVSVASFRRRIWATTTCSFADGGDRVMNSGPVVNGKLHWVINGKDNSDFSNQIVYFDPVTDEFVELPVQPQPYSFRGRKTVILGLGVLEGCLCMTCGGCESGTEIEPSFIEVFVMREYGVGESWSNIFIISNNIIGLLRPYVYGNLVPLYFTKNREVLIAVNRNKLFVYNPNKMPQREILFSSHCYEIHITSYSESLASPAAYCHDEDWVEGGEDALELADSRWGFWSSCCTDWELFDADDSMQVWNGFWKKEENQEKFKRRYKARLYSLAAKEKNKKRQQRIRTQSERILLRKNKRKSKHGKNWEVEDLHRQVLDFVYDSNQMPERELISSDCSDIDLASYTESLASPAAYCHNEDWVQEREDALEWVNYTWIYESCYDRRDSYNRDWELFNLTEGDDEEDNKRVWNGFRKKEENQEKFRRRYRARLYFLAAKEKNKKRQQRVRTEGEIILLRKNKMESKHGKNLEVDDLRKVLDFFVK